eukprot:TRINITY_DN1173_c0_g1_i1.p2 TRINITY_DN1173_c0_g1~~TRINITY_DN1173_c0_g1_i1.p2  ORF type:complete len:347 (-),score=143.72 TRINITY_DN1173_c0_g1_i1:44-1084(-)
MGGILGKPDSKQQREIEKQLKKDAAEFDAEVKLLLLGPGESGKSTLAKQMKLIHLGGFSDAERQQFRDICHSNVLNTAKVLLAAAKQFGYKLDKKSNEHAKLVDGASLADELDDGLAAAVARLWKDSAIQKAFGRYSEFQLSDSAKYYMDSVARLAEADYVPSDEDILRVRAKTTGITELVFTVDSTKFRLVDVGGQRSERKKWMHCFDGVTAIVFVVAISEYDLMLYEDQNVRRMDESMQLFDEMCNSPVFVGTPIVLFLNKSDLFREKIKQVDLSTCFADYKGGADFERACAFTKAKFEALNKSPDTKRIYPHVTCATDTENVTVVFASVKDALMSTVLGNAGL